MALDESLPPGAQGASTKPALGSSATCQNDLRHWARHSPSHTAVACGDRSLSYAELEALANRLADVFRAFGLTRGDHVATLIGSRPEALAAVWAACRSGLYLTPLATSLTAAEVACIVADSDARLVIADATLAALAAELPQACKRDVAWRSLGGAIKDYVPLEPLLAMASTQPAAHEPPGALMVYTSGTTGAPKGVFRPLPQPDSRTTPAFAADLLDLFRLSGQDVRYLSTAPLYHAAPLRFALAVTAGGGTVHLMERFDADKALDALERHRITHSLWVPAMFQRLLALPESRRTRLHAPSHRLAIHGAAPCPVGLKQAMIDWWGPIFEEYYSGSEGIGLTRIDSAEWRCKPGSVGRARKGVVHIVDEAGCELPAGNAGLVYFSGVAPFVYYKAPEKTRSRTLPNGWQTFGDIGWLDTDGYVYLTDRQDDMIISGGVNLYPQEIEAVIREAPGVWDCAVVGVSDERFGERPVAFVVPVRGPRVDAPALIAEVQRHCEQHLGRFKRPTQIQTLDSLPRSPTGKLLRRQLRELVIPDLENPA